MTLYGRAHGLCAPVNLPAGEALIELGAAMMVASTIVPARISSPLPARCALISSKSARVSSLSWLDWTRALHVVGDKPQCRLGMQPEQQLGKQGYP